MKKEIQIQKEHQQEQAMQTPSNQRPPEYSNKDIESDEIDEFTEEVKGRAFITAIIEQ